MVSVVVDFGTGRVDHLDDRSRFPVARLDATLTIGGVRFEVAVRNVSGGGLCVVSEIPLDPLDICTVSLADGKPHRTAYRAEVRWVKVTSNELVVIGLQIVDGPAE